MKKLIFAVLVLSCVCSAQLRIWTSVGGGTSTLFSDGFENAGTLDTSKWTATGAPTMSTTAHAGTYSLSCAATGTDVYAEHDVSPTVAGNGTTLYFRWYMRMPSLSSSGLAYIVGPANRNQRVEMNGANKLNIINFGDGGAVLGSTALIAGAWYRVELKIVESTTATGSIELRVYDSGGTLIDNPAATTGLITSRDANVLGIQLGVLNGSTGTALFDDVAISTTGWIGA